jgi:hypothetical protein
VAHHEPTKTENDNSDGARSGAAVSPSRQHGRRAATRHTTAELSKMPKKVKAARQDCREYAGRVAQAFVGDPFQGTLGGFASQIC